MKRWLGKAVVVLAFTAALAELLVSVGCATITRYDQNTYNAATALKVDAMAVVTTPEAWRVEDVDRRIQAQVAYETGKGKANWTTATQWRLLADPQGHLWGGWCAAYRAGKPGSAVYRQEKAAQIGTAFDEVLKLEGGKQR